MSGAVNNALHYRWQHKTTREHRGKKRDRYVGRRIFLAMLLTNHNRNCWTVFDFLFYFILFFRFWKYFLASQTIPTVHILELFLQLMWNERKTHQFDGSTQSYYMFKIILFKHRNIKPLFIMLKSFICVSHSIHHSITRINVIVL